MSGDAGRSDHGHAHLIKVPEAARITGLPSSLIRKSFICEEKRPRNIPGPPPHKKIGRSVFIITDKLAEWVRNLEVTGVGQTMGSHGKQKRGRPTVADRIARRRNVGS